MVAVKKTRVRRAVLDTLRSGPDDLADRIYWALIHKSLDERTAVVSDLLEGLQRAGVHVGATMLMIGVRAETAEDVTAPEVGKLIRYLAINRPAVVDAVAPRLQALLDSSQLFESAAPFSKAA